MTKNVTAARTLPALLLACMLHACSNAPVAPTWQMEAKGSMERAIAAYLEGNRSVEAAELARARKALSSTGRAAPMANAELLYCAARVASLVYEPCSGFEALRADADAAQGAYADYLLGQVTASDAAQLALLPPAQRAAATHAASDAQALQGIDDPLSTLVAASVALKTGRANPAIIAQAVDAASAQGWRRPLLAWLGVQRQRADQAGQTAEAARVQRRIDWVQGATSTAP